MFIYTNTFIKTLTQLFDLLDLQSLHHKTYPHHAEHLSALLATSCQYLNSYKTNHHIVAYESIMILGLGDMSNVTCDLPFS